MPQSIDDDVVFDQRAVFVPASDALVVADLHVGRARASRVTLGLPEREQLCAGLRRLLDRHEPSTVVLAGDLRHRRGDRSKATSSTVEAVVDTIRATGAELIPLAGNHDGSLEGMLPMPARTSARLSSGHVVCHGHERPRSDEAVTGYIVGHDHPAIELEGRKRPCFLAATTPGERTAVLAVPAFSRVARGVDISKAPGFDSPLLPAPDRCRPIVYDRYADRTLRFPPLGRFRRAL